MSNATPVIQALPPPDPGLPTKQGLPPPRAVHTPNFHALLRQLGASPLRSARTFCGIGKAIGEAMIELRRAGAKN